MLTLLIITVLQDQRGIDGNVATVLKNLMFLLSADR